MNHFFDQLRSRMPPADAPFIAVPGGRRFTYGDLLDTSARMAGVLLAHGVAPGDRVAVQVEKSPEAIFLYLACVRAGVVYLPLNPAYTPPEVAYYASDAEPKLIVCSPEKLAAVAALAPPGTVVDTLGSDGSGSLMALAAVQPAALGDVARGSDDLAAILYTSGTTGRSKGAMLSHENLASNARVLVDAWRFAAADRLLHALPIFHTHGLFTATNTALFAGASMIFLPRFDAAAVLAALPDATVMMGVPTFYVRLLDEPALNRAAVAGVRLFISGSAPLLPETHAAFLARTGHAILERYGMTETGMNTSNPYDGPRVPGSVGPPLPGILVRIADETGSPVAAGEVGMIELKGPNVCGGYWRMPEKTAVEFRGDGYFITGDLGRIDANGYVHIVGRAKDLVISGGLNVYPLEVEDEIDRLHGVVESAVIGLPHPDLGEGVTAVVVPASASALDEAAIIHALDGRLAGYKRPKRVLFVDALPRNAMGKVQKAALRDRYADLYRNAPG